MGTDTQCPMMVTLLDQVADEEEWKSVARRKMLQFEQQLHEGDFSLGYKKNRGGLYCEQQLYEGQFFFFFTFFTWIQKIGRGDCPGYHIY